jgi:hypothetical protein
MVLGISQDTEELLQSLFKAAISLFKIVMGSMLAVFVPQYCPESGNTCTIKQQFTDLTKYNEFVLAWNFLTLAAVIGMRLMILLRERFLIAHFDEDRSQPDFAFESVLKQFPVIEIGLYRQNMRCRLANIFAMFMTATNVIFSTALIIIYWDDYRSGTVLTTNGVLILELVWTSLSVLLDRTRVTNSCMRFDSVFHNVVDPDWVKQHGAWGAAQMVAPAAAGGSTAIPMPVSQQQQGHVVPPAPAMGVYGASGSQANPMAAPAPHPSKSIYD